MITYIGINKLRPTGAECQKADGKGLVLVVRAKGDKFWRYEARINGKKFKYGFGNYPEISLDQARQIQSALQAFWLSGGFWLGFIDSPKKSNDQFVIMITHRLIAEVARAVPPPMKKAWLRLFLLHHEIRLPERALIKSSFLIFLLGF